MPSVTQYLLGHGVINATAHSQPRLVAAGMLALDPGVQANNSIPGIAQLQSIVGGLMTIAIIACLAGMILSALAWGIGSHHGNSRFAQTGKTGLIIAVVAAFLVGGSDAIITYFSNTGSAI